MKDVNYVHRQHSPKYHSIARGRPVYTGDLTRLETHELPDNHSDIWVKQPQCSGLTEALAKSNL